MKAVDDCSMLLNSLASFMDVLVVPSVGDNGVNLNTHTILITDGVEIKDQLKYIPKD